MTELKIVSYNLDHSKLRENIVENIMSLSGKGAGLFCLQEVRVPKAEEFIGDLILKKLGPNWSGEFFVSHESKNDYGLAMLWNTEILKPVKFHQLFFPRLEKLDYYERFIESFILSGETQTVKRGGLIGTFNMGDKLLRISNIHLDWHGWIGHRAKQVEHLVNYLKAEPISGSEVICGDFNTLGFMGYGQRLKEIESLFDKDFVNIFPKFHYTTSHFQQLDHFFVRNIKINQAEVFHLPGSDHYPIMTDLSLT